MVGWVGAELVLIVVCEQDRDECFLRRSAPRYHSIQSGSLGVADITVARRQHCNFISVFSFVTYALLMQDSDDFIWLLRW